MGVDGFCFDCVLSHCAAASSAVGGGVARWWGQVGGEFFRKRGYGRGRRSVAALAGSGGNVASTVCADEEAMLGGNVDERYGTKTRQ